MSAGDQRLGGQGIVGGKLDPVHPQVSRDDLCARPFEDTELRGAVRVEGAVPVEVVGLEIEEDRNVAGERVDILELEARELADDP